MDVTVPVGKLSPAQRAIVAIARALDGWTRPDNVLLLDEPAAALHGDEVQKSLVPPIDPANVHRVGHGLLKVSHRRLDNARSTEYWPVHTHAEADHQPLEDGEIVAIEVGLYPSSALIRKGCRLRIDVQPYSPAGLTVRAYDESYQLGATNTLYSGPDHPNYVQLPIAPAK